MFLVLGAGRGGTSLLAGLLDQHEDLEVAFERFAQPFLMGKRRDAEGPRLAWERAEAFRAACERLARRSSGKLWGNKITTEQLRGLEDHNRLHPEAPLDPLEVFFHDVFPGTKVVFILRDGRTCVRSKMARTELTLEEACARWRYSVAVHRFLRDEHLVNVRIRYENLVRSPEETLDTVCEFLDVPFRASMLDGTSNPKMRAEYRQDTFDVSRLTLDGVPAGCPELIEDELRECAYVEGGSAQGSARARR